MNIFNDGVLVYSSESGCSVPATCSESFTRECRFDGSHPTDSDVCHVSIRRVPVIVGRFQELCRVDFSEIAQAQPANVKPALPALGIVHDGKARGVGFCDF